MKDWTESLNPESRFVSFDGLAEVDPSKVLKAVPRMTDYKRLQARAVVAERLRRMTEATAIYQPLDEQARFHRSKSKTRIVYGSNRSGKTTCGAFEIGFIVSNRHPFYNYPKTGRIICVGPNEDHIGHTMWDKLCHPIAKMQMIRDGKSKLWRPYRWWEDAERKAEAKGMSAIIPSRLIDRVAYRTAGKNVPAVVYLKTGWEIWWFTAGSSPPRGIDVDYAWADEEIANDEFYREIMARLVDRKGRFTWTATPQTGGASLWNIHLRCEEYRAKMLSDPPCEEFFLTIDNNKYMEPAEVEAFKEEYKNDPEAYRVRVMGEFLITSFRVYPTFHKTSHVIPPIRIEDNWARYIAIDPGHVTCAVLFMAVPPDGKHVYCYDELYIRDCDSHTLAERVRHKIQGQNIQAFIIDYHGSIRTEAGGQTIAEQYSKEFQRKGLYSIATGCSFIPSSGSIEAGLSKVREWLSPADDGVPKLQVFENCTNLIHEMERYHKKREKGLIIDKPEQAGFHAVDCLRYSAMNGCPYVKPMKLKKHKSPAMQYLEKKRKKSSSDGSIYLSGTGVG